MTPTRHPEAPRGFVAALGAFLMWGLLPMYWKAVQAVPPVEILSHRIVWALLFIGTILTLQGRWAETLAPLRKPRNIGILVLSSLCIASNWLLYIWAVNNNHVLATSLGYYINPLVNVLLGFIFFRERLSAWQRVAIILAVAGVLNSIISYGELPWISLFLAFSFGLYGLLRKISVMESLPGLFLEATVVAPFAVSYLIYVGSNGTGSYMAGNPTVSMLLMGAGVVTATPLIGFAFGARRLQLTTLGILQYTAPSIAFLLGVFFYDEPFTTSHLITFGLIWTALAVYTADSVRTIRKHRRLARG